ncbi:MAG TPA: CPBP family intramembrane metalloprotease [Actinobacteria bacterium]|nr:CPBP family intramembrane metalloprotease [Actinomycetota bacterium]
MKLKDRKVPWNIADVGKVFVVFLAVLIIQIYSGLFWLSEGHYLNNPFARTVLMIGSYLIIFLLVWFFGLRRKGGSFKDLGFKSFNLFFALGKGVLWLILIKILTVLYSVFTSEVLNFKPPPELVTGVPDIFGRGSIGFLMAIFATVIVAPLVEEIFFRGFIYTALRDKIGVVWAALISSFIFAVFHGNLWSIVPIMLLGLILVYLYERGNSIGPPVIFHALNNLVSVLLIYSFLL